MLTGVLTAWVRPGILTSAKLVTDPMLHLDYVTLEVAGETKLLKNGDELKLVVGDVFTVKDAFLVDKRERAVDINVVGFSHDDPKSRASDDRGHRVDTAKLVYKPQWSERGEGQVYGVAVRSGRRLHGVVYIRLIEPRLQFAEITINGQPRTMRDGEALTLRRSDQLKIKRVSTNLHDDQGVMFQVVEQVGVRGGSPLKPDLYEIRFLRSGRKFASIPLKVLE